MLQQIKSRQLQLFKLLVDETTYKPTHYFSNALRVSYKTIYNDIDYLNEIMKQFNINILKIPRHGLILNGDNDQKEKFLEYLTNNEKDIKDSFSPIFRRIEIIKILMIDVQSISLVELEEKFYVTQASLRNDLEFLQQFFKPFHIKFATSKNILLVEGCEHEIQRALKQFLMDLVKQENDDYYATMNTDPIELLIEDMFDKRLVKQVNDILHHLLEISNRNISDYYIRSILVILLILITRIHKDCHMKPLDVQMEDISSLEPYMIAVETAEMFEKQSGLKFNLEDIHYLSEQLFAHGIEPSASNVVLREQYIDDVNSMIVRMSDLLKIDLTNDKKLKDSLMFHVPPMIYRLKRKIRVANPLLREIKRQYIVLFSLMWYVASDLEQKYDVLLDDDEISFLSIYFQVSVEKRHGIHFKNIIIVCPIGLATSELIFTKVRQILPSIDNICTQTVDELYSSDLSSVDFVISTVKLKPIMPEIIYVSPLVTDDDMERITKGYSKLNNKMTSLQSTQVHNDTSLLDYFDREFIYANLDVSSKEECLDYLIEQYLKNKLVTKEFRTSIYEREKLGDTSMYTGVAIPHAMPDTVKKSRISFVTLKNKIPWGENQVNVVVLIGIANEDINCIKAVLSRLYYVMESNEIINQLITQPNRDSIYKVLKKIL